jgi:hypothetical protein
MHVRKWFLARRWIKTIVIVGKGQSHGKYRRNSGLGVVDKSAIPASGYAKPDTNKGPAERAKVVRKYP